MTNKRLYTRLDTDIYANLYEAIENKEILCRVKNISEFGICFETPTDAPFIERLQKGDDIRFQFVDSFRLDDKIKTEILSVKSRIKHITRKKDSYLIGCYVNRENFRDYFRHKQLHSMYYNKVG